MQTRYLVVARMVVMVVERGLGWSEPVTEVPDWIRRPQKDVLLDRAGQVLHLDGRNGLKVRVFRKPDGVEPVLRQLGEDCVGVGVIGVAAAGRASPTFRTRRLVNGENVHQPLLLVLQLRDLQLQVLVLRHQSLALLENIK